MYSLMFVEGFMSSSYPPFGNASTRPCQHCEMLLSFNKVYCRNCGGYNTPVLSNYSSFQPSSGTFRGGAPSSNNSSNSIGYSSSDFAQPLAGGFQAGSMDGYKPADFAQPPKSQKRPRRRIVRIVLPILLIVLLLVAAVIGGIGVYFSNAIIGVVHYTPTY